MNLSHAGKGAIIVFIHRSLYLLIMILSNASSLREGLFFKSADLGEM